MPTCFDMQPKEKYFQMPLTFIVVGIVVVPIIVLVIWGMVWFFTNDKILTGMENFKNARPTNENG